MNDNIPIDPHGLSSIFYTIFVGLGAFGSLLYKFFSLRHDIELLGQKIEHIEEEQAKLESQIVKRLDRLDIKLDSILMSRLKEQNQE